VKLSRSGIVPFTATLCAAGPGSFYRFVPIQTFDM